MTKEQRNSRETKRRIADHRASLLADGLGHFDADVHDNEGQFYSTGSCPWDRAAHRAEAMRRRAGR